MPSNSHSGTHVAVAYPPLFSITSTMPIFQVLYFHIHAWNGGYGGLPTFQHSNVPFQTIPQSIPFPFKRLRTPLRHGRTSTPLQSIRYALFSPRRRVYPPRLPTSLLPYLLTSLLHSFLRPARARNHLSVFWPSRQYRGAGRSCTLMVSQSEVRP
jgi:hypothetical protein